MPRRIALLLCVTALFAAAQRQPRRVWAAITVRDPVVRPEGRDSDVIVCFGLVNDGPETIDPKTEESHLIVNGAEIKNWGFIIANGIRGVDWSALPPGGFLSFTYALGEYFQKPGVYTLRWEGRDFRTRDIEFRVLPKRSPGR